MLEGSCHCGAVHWRFDGVPADATVCNCTPCRRYGVIWAYDYEGERIVVTGATRAYQPGDHLTFEFCPTCGNLACWRSTTLDPQGRRRIAVNLRLAEPAQVAHIPIDRFDGLDTFTDTPRDGRTVGDYWW